MEPQKRSLARGAKKASSPATAPATPMDAISLLEADHRTVEDLFERFKTASDEEEKAEIAATICNELIVHTIIEEEIFYPACREKLEGADALDEAQVEHDGAKLLIRELQAQSPGDAYYDAKATVLSEYIKHHVGEEEKPGDGIFAKARDSGLDMSALGQRLQLRKAELAAKAEAEGLRPSASRSLHNGASRPSQREEQQMARYDRERDEEGRFVSEDDYRGRRGRYYDDDDRYRGGRYARERDEEGRFVSENEGNGRRRRSDDDDDRRYSRGHGGWYGDPEGHAEASERGWDERRGSSRGRYEDEDERRGYARRGSRSRYQEEDDRYASGGRGHGGWYGDPEGHSEASERGWEGRRSPGGRYSDDDDDRRRSRSHEHGGWYGDPRGHAEASRRGWRNRD
jgi:hypothetical protein